MNHENHVIDLFIGYSFLDRARNEMKANCSVTLIKGEHKTILVSLFITFGNQQVLLKENYF